MKLKSMGLTLKAPKCQSLSIQGGKISNIPLSLDNSGKPVNILSVLEKPMKFFGSEVTADNSQSAMFASMKTELETKLENINKSTLRAINLVI